MGTTHTLEAYLRLRYAETGETEFRLQLVGVGDNVRAYLSPAHVAARGADVTIDDNQISVRELGVMTPPGAKPRSTDPRQQGPM